MVIAALVVATLISTSGPALAADGASVATAMVADVIIARPSGFVGMILGAAAFIVALPFALTSGGVEPVVRTLVVEPFNSKFTRPVGDFSCWD
jgi:hypothetical protein